MKYPKPLKKGDQITLIAPSSNVKREFIEKGIELLRRHGYSTTQLPSFSYKAFYFLAGSDIQRADQIHRALSSKNHAALWFARGGYGSVRLLPMLDSLFPHPPEGDAKTVIGCSDTTFLLIYFLQKWKWVVYHGPMVAGSLARGEDAVDSGYLFSLLEGRPVRKIVSPIHLKSLKTRTTCEGRLTGGCLSIICATLGTPYEIDTNNKIIFLEDTNIKPYQLDRMLTQLRYAGKFDHCRGIVFGQFPNCLQHPDQGYTIEDVITFSLKGLELPVLFGLSSGHSLGGDIPLALGAKYILDTREGNLILEDTFYDSNIQR